MLARLTLRSFAVILALWVVVPVRAQARVEAVKARSSELTAATRSWKMLAGDRRKRDRRDLWQRVIGRFEALARTGPASEKATALLSAAEATENMARVSRVEKDFATAAAAYRRAGAPEKAERLESEHPAIARKSAPAAKVAEKKKDAEPPMTTVAFASPAAEESPDAIAKLIGTVDAPVPASTPTTQGVRKLRASVLADPSMSLSEQVGLKVRRIIIDAGHGGHDEGATGPGKVHEKDVTLAIAKEVARILQERGYEVVLTRDSDEYVALEERTAIANKHKGDLFISIHANAAPSRKLSGVETYSLNVASNRFAMRLAARENATLESGVSDLQYVLADLATRANTVDSDRLARCVQESVVDGVAHKYGRPKDNGVKHALFYVLLGAKMPAILVETQFISNPREEKRLASAAYQATVARSIAAGVDQFVARRQPLASIDR